jgi:PAS domain S-box-containing protein
METLREIRWALDQAAIVSTTDHRGIITSVNDRLCTISGYSREELVGQNHRIINSGYHLPAFFADLWRTIARGSVWRGELRNRAKNGSFFWVDTTIVPLLDSGGTPPQYLAIHNDITARKDAEAQLRSQAALAHLGQLAAAVAHEVRNPLAGLRASLQVLDRRCSADPSAHPVIATMIQRIDELNGKLGDLLLYAQPKPARLHPVDVRSVALDVAATARAAMGDTHPPVSVGGEPAVARADPDMLRAALLNLTLNACQAAAGAGVELQVERDDRVCRISVCDHGPGIPAALRDRLFEPFFTTRPGGTGLGLVVTRRLLELQGGAVALKDRPEGGTVAEVTLPAAPH